MNESNEIIDLTESFTIANRFEWSGEYINLDPDSFVNKTPLNKQRKKNKNRKRKAPMVESEVLEFQTPRKLKKWGECPICCEELGKNPLASTNCGHVFCYVCLEKALGHKKECPTCRKVLKKKSGYHPLYLEC